MLLSFCSCDAHLVCMCVCFACVLIWDHSPCAVSTPRPPPREYDRRRHALCSSLCHFFQRCVFWLSRGRIPTTTTAHWVLPTVLVMHIVSSRVVPSPPPPPPHVLEFSYVHALANVLERTTQPLTPRANQVCRFFQNGLCKLGAQCKFAHVASSPSVPVSASISSGAALPAGPTDQSAAVAAVASPLPASVAASTSTSASSTAPSASASTVSASPAGAGAATAAASASASSRAVVVGSRVRVVCEDPKFVTFVPFVSKFAYRARGGCTWVG